jgi:DNA polymerase-1
MVRVISPGLEADDAIATLVQDVSGDDRAFVVTGDRDLLCLVRDPHVHLLFTVKGVRELKEFDESGVEETYGIHPSRYIEFAMLRGDPSDGLPGVAGIGPTRASRLLAKYGSLDEVLAHASELPPAQAAAFESSAEYLKQMRTVVPPVTDAPIEATKSGPTDTERVEELARRHNLDGPIKRFSEARAALREEGASQRS